MRKRAETRDRTGDLQIFSLTLSQLSYRGCGEAFAPMSSQRRNSIAAIAPKLRGRELNPGLLRDRQKY